MNAALPGRIGELARFGLAIAQGEVEIGLHQFVADAHRFAVHLLGRFGDADVIAQRLAHFLFAVQPDKQRHGQDALRLLTGLALQVAPDEKVEFLVRSADFDVRANHHRIVALHQRIHEFVQVDRLAGGMAFLEIVAFEHARHRHPRKKPDHILEFHREEPAAVEFDFRFVRIEDFIDLIEIGLGVALDFLFAQLGPGFGAAGRIADAPRAVADDENHHVPHVLELAQLAQHYPVAQMQVRRGRVRAQFDPQGAVLLAAANELGQQVLVGNDLHRPVVNALPCVGQFGGDAERGIGFGGHNGSAPKARGFGRLGEAAPDCPRRRISFARHSARRTSRRDRRCRRISAGP
ncbi:MAG: hypothetical protein BWZ10_03013 [candidate division BRC1 bacterium ADurb.BinA364]|nr:MAG: hypothetical protein BWZ10_03013 [candidate division BRC1 bacterium ADurb.BinA364]